MKVVAIIFDVDGVLLDSNKMLAEIHTKAAKLLGIRIPKDYEYSVLWGRPFKDLVKRVWPDVDVELMGKTCRKVIDNEKIVFPPMKNAIKTLKKLKNMGFKLSIVTGRSRGTTIEFLVKAGFDVKFFDAIVTCDDTKNHKPHPDPILHVCKLLKVKPNEVIYVGDSLVDFEASRKANVRFVGVLSGDLREEELRKNGVENVISSVSELPKFLKS